MITKSFVDGFKSRKISTETLVALLKVSYQFEILLELVFRAEVNSQMEITQVEEEIIKAENEEYLIFFLLSTREEKLQKVRENKSGSGQMKKLIAFNKGEVKKVSEEIQFIDPLDWMNAIISNGINRKILHLQFMRDMEFNRESSS